jgi:hypothetical protein
MLQQHHYKKEVNDMGDSGTVECPKALCGSSYEYGWEQFWVLDLSCTRLFVVPKSMRVDFIADKLADFLGIENDAPMDLTLVGEPSSRAQDIYEYLTQIGKEDENDN